MPSRSIQRPSETRRPSWTWAVRPAASPSGCWRSLPCSEMLCATWKAMAFRPESHGSETFQGSRMSIWPWLFATAFGLKVPGMLDCEGGAWPPEWRRFRLAASEVPRHGQLRELRAHNLQLGSSLSVWKSSDPGKGPGELVFACLLASFSSLFRRNDAVLWCLHASS